MAFNGIYKLKKNFIMEAHSICFATEFYSIFGRIAALFAHKIAIKNVKLSKSKDLSTNEATQLLSRFYFVKKYSR
jgi:hypothetical protein